MEVAPLLISLAILVLVVAYVGRPLVERRALEVTDEERRLSALQAERDRLLRLLQDLEMDQAMGKIDAEDYELQRAPLVLRGARVLREIDELAPAGVAPARSPEDDLEREIARRRHGGTSTLTAAHCVQCGAALDTGDRFCVRCGAPVADEVAA